jgi:mono/diheme cytochrome c family protein
MRLSVNILSRNLRISTLLGQLALLLAVPAGGALAADPPPADAAAVERGAQLFQQYCTECHGRDGRAQLDVISDATDLTMPLDYYSGYSDQDIYNSIANGAGVAMPAWRQAVGSDEAVWDLVYFVKSLWVEQP